jgi:predicted DNA-binding transcriptional regulator AlpA
MDNKKLCMSVAEMAESLGLSLTVAYRLVKGSEFYPAKKIGGRIIVSVTELERWLGEQGAKKEEGYL